MRRLAKQSRDDTYNSNRDYQTLHPRRSRRIVPREGTDGRLVLEAPIPADSLGMACWGGYARASRSTVLTTEMRVGSVDAISIIHLDRNWRRIGGVLTDVKSAGVAKLTLRWGGGWLDLWGLSAARPKPPTDSNNDNTVVLLSRPHLIPETFYLPHDTIADAEIKAEESVHFRTTEGGAIALKKCSYCGRLLPVDPKRLGALAFHKHNAKVSKHQNECRACKKWRINDSFNPLRTVDQLHESSVITRERKLFLREPEILQQIKDRTGAGLKSKVWLRFGKRCFRCRRDVALSEFQLDHTRPLAYLWPIDEFATCLCPECNNEKKEKFPVDFYGDAQLRHLSTIIGLPLPELRAKSINKRELQRILDDLPKFSRDWEPRTFFATARKVSELRPDIDLFAELRSADVAEYERLLAELRDRPPPVGDE